MSRKSKRRQSKASSWFGAIVIETLAVVMFLGAYHANRQAPENDTTNSIEQVILEGFQASDQWDGTSASSSYQMLDASILDQPHPLVAMPMESPRYASVATPQPELTNWTPIRHERKW